MHRQSYSANSARTIREDVVATGDPFAEEFGSSGRGLAKICSRFEILLSVIPRRASIWRCKFQSRIARGGRALMHGAIVATAASILGG